MRIVKEAETERFVSPALYAGEGANRKATQLYKLMFVTFTKGPSAYRLDSIVTDDLSGEVIETESHTLRVAATAWGTSPTVNLFRDEDGDFAILRGAEPVAWVSDPREFKVGEAFNRLKLAALELYHAEKPEAFEEGEYDAFVAALSDDKDAE